MPDTRGISYGNQIATEEERDQRLTGLVEGYLTNIMEAPMAVAEWLAPDSGHTPGELRSSPKDRLRGERYAWEEYLEDRKKNPDYASGSQLGTGAAVVADPFFDLPGLTAARIAPQVAKAIKNGIPAEEALLTARRLLMDQGGAIKGADDQYRLRGAEDLPEVGSTNPSPAAKKFEKFIGEQGDLNPSRQVRDEKFGENLSEEAKKYISWTKGQAKKNNSIVHDNSKTGLSIDFCTSCPKRMGGKGRCAYCYVDNSRSGFELREASKKTGQDADMFKADWMPGKGLTETQVTDEILRMPPDLVTELNKDGGLRMFSFGDFRPDLDDANVSEVLKQAKEKNLIVKAITKEPELIKRFGDHPNLRVNFSTDALPPDISRAIPLDEAYEMTKGMDNVKIRTVAVNPEQAKMYAEDPRVDVVTLYHGPTGEKLLKIVKHDNPDLVKEVGEERLLKEFESWKDMTGWADDPPKGKKAKDYEARHQFYKDVSSKEKNKLCCQGGKCAKDKTKCGFGLSGLIPGVLFEPLTEEEERQTSSDIQPGNAPAIPGLQGFDSM